MSDPGDEQPPQAPSPPASDRLDSWKEIAAYLRRGVSTVQRWERDEDLPTHRLHHSKLGSVYAFKGELDTWIRDRRERIEPESPENGDLAGELRGGNGASARPASIAPGPRLSLIRWAGLAALLVGGFLVVSRLVSSPRPEPSPGPPRALPITSSRGLERHPALSSDGRHLAYVSNEAGPSFDLYVKDVNSPTSLRLTTSAESECCPAWSPDQQLVAFLRLIGNEAVLLTMPAMGGAETRRAGLGHWFGSGLSWSPDGRAVAYSDRASPDGPFVVKLLDVATGDARDLTTASPAWSGDAFARFSPDGRHVAFARLSASGDVAAADVYVVPSAGGEPRRLTHDMRFVGDVDWTADGGAVVYITNRSFPLRFWKVALSGGAPTLVFAGGDPFAIDSFSEALMDVSHAFRFSAARSLDRLALTQRLYDTNIFRLELGTPESTPPKPLIGSSQVDESPQVSPDGQRIAFTSMRSGYLEIWVCDRDGSACGSLVRTLHGGTPRWSPDGRLIVYDNWPAADDRADVFTIDVSTREVRRITATEADDVVPSFSRDGKSIYFASNRTGSWQVFRTGVDGAEAHQVTREGGFAAFESPSGDAIFYTRFNLPGLFRVPRGGGSERQVLDRPRCWGHWAVAPDGLYVLDSRENQKPRIEFLGWEGGASREIATLEQRPPCAESSLAASPDGRFLLYVGVEEGSDIARVDGFR